MLQPVRTVPPTALPVSIDEAKAHLGYEDDDKDGLISGMINAATTYLDGYSGILGRPLLDQTWTFGLCTWPSCRIRIPFSPVRSVLSVKYFDADNVQRTLDRANYSVTAVVDASFPGGTRYVPLEDALSPYINWWPTTVLPLTYQRDDAIEVSVTVGYGAAKDVPAPIKQSILLLIAHWFANRETISVGDTTAELDFTVKALTAPYRRHGF